MVDLDMHQQGFRRPDGGQRKTSPSCPHVVAGDLHESYLERDFCIRREPQILGTLPSPEYQSRILRRAGTILAPSKDERDQQEYECAHQQWITAPIAKERATIVDSQRPDSEY
jgi:hypothetical protein